MTCPKSPDGKHEFRDGYEGIYCVYEGDAYDSPTYSIADIEAQARSKLLDELEKRGYDEEWIAAKRKKINGGTD